MKAETLLVFFVAAIFLQQKNVYGFNQNRIYNGTVSPDGEFEFLAALSLVIQGPVEDKIWSGICSSTVISPRHLLTAAHCVVTPVNGIVQHVPVIFVDYRPKEKIVTTFKDGEMERVQLKLKNYATATKIYYHQSYNPDHHGIMQYHHASEEPFLHDIAIIEFPEGTNLNIPPIKLASGYVEQKGDTAIAAGYGNYEHAWDPAKQDYVPMKPSELLNATVPVHLPTECPLGFAVPSLICTAEEGLHASNGDSGGPLFLRRNEKYYQIGVTSIGNHTVFYVRVDKYCDWISKITNNEAKCEPLPPAPLVPNAETDAPPQPTNTEAQQSPSDANVAFTLNVLLLLLIGIFFFG